MLACFHAKGTGHISFTTSGCSSNTHNTLVSGTIKFQTKHYKYSKEVEEVKSIVKAQSEEIQALRANQEALAQAVAIQK